MLPWMLLRWKKEEGDVCDVDDDDARMLGIGVVTVFCLVFCCCCCCSRETLVALFGADKSRRNRQLSASHWLHLSTDAARNEPQADHGRRHRRRRPPIELKSPRMRQSVVCCCSQRVRACPAGENVDRPSSIGPRRMASVGTDSLLTGEEEEDDED